MEKSAETPLKELNQLESNNNLEQKTPPPPLEVKIGLKTKLASLNGTPDLLLVPKAFKHPERYISPTDRMISPVSKGLIARSRRPGSLLPPSINQPSKIRDLQSDDVVKVQQTMEELKV